MYKQTKPLGSSGKIQVTPEQSEVVQKALFEMGYAWADGAIYVQMRSVPYIFWDIDKEITLSPLYKSFNNSSNPIHLFTDYFEPIK